MIMMKTNYVGDGNTLTSVRILTLFAEATRMSQPYIFLFFTEATMRGNNHFQYIIKYFLLIVLYYFRCVFADGQNRTISFFRCTGYLYRLLELATNQSRNICLMRYGVKLCPVEAWYKTQTRYSSHLHWYRQMDWATHFTITSIYPLQI